MQFIFADPKTLGSGSLGSSWVLSTLGRTGYPKHRVRLPLSSYFQTPIFLIPQPEVVVYDVEERI